MVSIIITITHRHRNINPLAAHVLVSRIVAIRAITQGGVLGCVEGSVLVDGGDEQGPFVTATQPV